MTGRLLQTVIRRAESLAAEMGPEAISDSVLLARFAANRDEAAFATLVNRHGPMVWAVCRHLLLDSADAEDAFQATFLALVRSARALPAGSAVGGWLHGVALRSAAQLRRSAARRRRREERAAQPEAGRPVPDAAWDALVTALHEEVQLLPEALRTAFVLCDLEGVRQPDAASRLGWKLGTLSGRLTKARQRLLGRLSERGIAPGVASGALVVGAAAAGGAVPAGLATRLVELSTAAADAVPPALWKLVLEVTPMTVNRTKLIAACVLLAGGLVAGLGPALVATADAQPPPKDGGAGGYAAPPSAFPTGPGGPQGKGDLPMQPGAGGYPGPMAGMMAAVEPARPRWEYEFAAKPRTSQEFRALLRKYGEQGWEYSGIESFDDPRPVPSGDPMGAGGAAPALVVFKRPVRATPMGGGPRFGPTPGGMPPTGGPSGGDPRLGPSPGGRPPTAGPARGEPFRPSGPDTGGPGGRGLGPGRPATGDPGMRTGEPLDRGPGQAGFQVLALKNARALDIAATLKQLFGNVQVVGDARSNSIILKADPETEREIVELIRKLDVPGVDDASGTGGSGGAEGSGGGPPRRTPGVGGP